MRYRSLLLIGAAVAIGLILTALLLLRWALDPRTLKAQAETRLTAALGQPVTIGSVRLSLVPSITVVGTDVFVSAAAEANYQPLQIHVVRIHPRISSIFRRPIVIDRVEIDGMTVNARRDAGGRVRLPLPDPRLANAGDGRTPATIDIAEILLTNGRLVVDDASRAAPARPAAIDHIEAAVRRVDYVTRLEGLTASVGHSRVVGSGALSPDGAALDLRWMDLAPADLPVVFALLGSSAPAGLSIEGKTPLTLEVRVDRAGSLSASGKLSAARASLGTVTLTGFQSPVALAGKRLSLEQMAFSAYSGTGHGRLVADIAVEPPAWRIDADMRHMDINQFLTANTSARNKVSGFAGIRARLGGRFALPIAKDLTGNAAVRIDDGVVHDFPLVSALNSALGVGGGDRELRFETLTGTFRIARATATTTDLVVLSGQMTLTAAGTISFDQSLDLDGTARFSRSRSDQMVHSVRELSALRNADGEIEVPVTIRGTASAPSFGIDVWTAARRGVQKEIKRRLTDRLKDIFRKKKD